MLTQVLGRRTSFPRDSYAFLAPLSENRASWLRGSEGKMKLNFEEQHCYDSRSVISVLFGKPLCLVLPLQASRAKSLLCRELRLSS